MSRKKIADEFAPGSEMVQAVDTGRLMERANAIAAGYEVSAWTPPVGQAPSASAAPADGPGIKLRSWRSAIMTSPEAKNRDDATVELVTTHSPETLSVDDARAFLRGLPTEQPERTTPNVTTNPDPRAARLAELQGSMKSFNSDRGYRSPRQPVIAGPSLAGVDPVKLKRLAELRAAALETGQTTHASREEAKGIRYALSVHDQTGLPLVRAFAQSGVDTSKFIR